MVREYALAYIIHSRLRQGNDVARRNTHDTFDHLMYRIKYTKWSNLLCQAALQLLLALITRQKRAPRLGA